MPIRNPAVECLDFEGRGQQQLERLQSTLNRAYKNVPFYRNQLTEHRIDPLQIENLSDLASVPFTDRSHFSEHYPYGLFAVPLRDVVRIHTAQGTSLNPVVSGYTKQDLVVWRELVARALAAAGVSGSDILQIHLEVGLTNWGREYKDGAEAIEASVIPLTNLPPEKQLMILKDYRTSVLVTTASAAAELMDLLFRSNLNPNELALKTLVLVGEAPDPGGLAAQLEERLHVRAWTHYGLSEVPGPALAFECDERSGLHLSEDHFLAEVIDPAGDVAVEPGMPGELVLTTLTTRAFPLIRYRTGDKVRWLEGPCPCGRTLRRMEWLRERSDEAMVIRGVKVYPRQLKALLQRILGHEPQGTRFQIQRTGRRDHLVVWLGVDELIFSDEIKEMEQTSLRLGSEMAMELGIPVRIQFKEPGSFEADGS
ncbi:MAG: phenylacetate--CoA ligase family protein [Syntrophobacteraceae bacterium]|jgi:phenylacetate-CoA ligase|nr:phenylacetate--CoA ligase family protein [Syntrophobacteraceae bacterium]